MGSYVAVLSLAACLAGCGGYTAFDPEGTSAVSFSGASSAAPSSGTTASSSDRREAATLDTLFAGAAEGDADNRAAPARPVTVASAPDIAPPARLPEREIAEPRGRARGVAGLIYSRGMDSLADRIRHAGVATSV